jgi:protein TonB
MAFLCSGRASCDLQGQGIRVLTAKEKITMFDKLVLSTQDHRKGRTGKFVFVTSLFYSLALASALVVSVVAASPMLYEKMDVTRMAAILPPPAPAPPQGPHSESPREPQQPTAPPDIYKVKDLETITRETSANQPPVTRPPSVDPVGGDYGPSGGTGGPGVIGGVDPAGNLPGINTGREIEVPPPPVQKPVEKPQPPAEKQMVRLPSTVLTGNALERKTPAYPPLAKQVRLEGAITVEIVISTDGRVESARALGGHPLLIGAAVEAARGWRFQPTLLNGIPVRATGVITFNFKLN